MQSVIFPLFSEESEGVKLKLKNDGARFVLQTFAITVCLFDLTNAQAQEKSEIQPDIGQIPPGFSLTFSVAVKNPSRRKLPCTTVRFASRKNRLLLEGQGVEEQQVGVLYDGKKSYAYRSYRQENTVRREIEIRSALPNFSRIRVPPLPIPGVNLPQLPLIKRLSNMDYMAFDITIPSDSEYGPAKITTAFAEGRVKLLRVARYYGDALGNEWVYSNHRLFKGVWIAQTMSWRQYDRGALLSEFEFQLTQANEQEPPEKEFDPAKWMLPGTSVMTYLPDGKELSSVRIPDPVADKAETDAYKNRLLAVGEVAPLDSPLTATDGKKVTLRDALQGKKALLLNFWFVGCPACRAEFPKLMRFYKEGVKKGLGALAVDYGDDAPAVKKYATEMKLSLPLALGDFGNKDSIFNRYRVEAYPTTYLLSSEGRVLFQMVGYDELGLRAILNEVGLTSGDGKAK